MRVPILFFQYFKHFPQYFFIVERIFNSFYLLVFFMSLSRYQYDVCWLCQADCRFNGFLPVADRNKFSSGCRVQVLLPYLSGSAPASSDLGIIGSENHLVTVLTGHFSHDRSFGFIPVAAASHHRDDVFIIPAQFV